MSDVLILAFVHMVGLVSPGPDFVVVSQNALIHDRSKSITTALGIASATLVHSLYCTIGLGYFIKNSPNLFTLIKYAGAIYLISLGVKNLTKDSSITNLQQQIPSITFIKAYVQGFLCNLLNPKATLFFISILSIILDRTDSTLIKSMYVFEIFFLTFLWFIIVATMLTHHKYKVFFHTYQTTFVKIFGVCLILLGAKLSLLEAS